MLVTSGAPISSFSFWKYLSIILFSETNLQADTLINPYISIIVLIQGLPLRVLLFLRHVNQISLVVSRSFILLCYWDTFICLTELHSSSIQSRPYTALKTPCKITIPSNLWFIVNSDSRSLISIHISDVLCSPCCQAL